MAKRAQFRRVEIDWFDSVADSGWGRLEKVDNRPSECQTMGYLVKASRLAVTVAQNHSHGTGNVGDLMTIPRCNIRRMRTLTRRPARGK